MTNPIPEETNADNRRAKNPRARNFKEIGFYISLELCPSCGNRLDEKKFRLSAETETAASVFGKCSRCKKPMGISFLGANLLSAPSGDWDELGLGRTEIILPWKLAAEIVLLSPNVFDDPPQLDLGKWKTNRDLNRRILLCAHELLKLLDDGSDHITDDLLSDEDLEYRKQHQEWFTREWIEACLLRARKISDAIIKDLPRINALEKKVPKRKEKRK